MDWSTFLKEKRGLVIAPAGHGKTHAIAECVMQCEEGKQLILTHTHAGISSLKSELKTMDIPPSRYSIQTISGFAQTIVKAFVDKTEMPDQEKEDYFEVIHRKAKDLLKCPSLQTIIRLSYKHLFVDEYQDCSFIQHELIMQIATCIPIHIFGDELQGIYNFRNSKNIDFKVHLSEFKVFDSLKTPWRWQTSGNCKELGNWILNTRNILLSQATSLTLRSSDAAHVKIMHLPENSYAPVAKVIAKIKSTSILILMPNYGYQAFIDNRSKIKPQFDYANQFLLLEAIDDKKFYQVSKNIDHLLSTLTTSSNKINDLYDSLKELTIYSGDIDKWFAKEKNRLITKQGSDKNIYQQLQNHIDNITITPSYTNYYLLLRFLINVCKCKFKRHGIIRAVKECLKNISNGMTLYQQMVEYKNSLRRSGKMITGKCFGTTLLTKGLEFDNVIILHADKFSNKKDFYVAISRACKNLILFMENDTIYFNN